MSSSKSHYKEKIARRKEEKLEESDNPKYRDRAKERRENQNPDYDPAELGSFHAVAPPGAVDLRAADALKLSIENSKYLGGDVEHTHLVKGLDYALLNKVKSEIDKKPDAEDDGGKTSAPKEDQRVAFRTAAAKSVYQWIVKPQTVIKCNEMFLPGRMTFVYDMEGGYTHDIPTTLYRSKADCPLPEDLVTINVDGSVLDRIAKIMSSYLRLGSSGKVLKKKKKEKDGKGILHLQGKMSTIANGYDEDSNQSKIENGSSENMSKREVLTPPPLPPVINHMDLSNKQEVSHVARTDDDETDILQDPQLMSQEEKDRGLGSVFKRDDQRLKKQSECSEAEENNTKRKKKQSEGSEAEDNNTKRKKKQKPSMSDKDVTTPSSKSTKKVKFSNQVEVFPAEDEEKEDEEEEEEELKLVRGKRFTEKEDELVKKSVLEYIDNHALGDEGINMILDCKSNPQVKGCWKEIATALPWRPYTSVYYRAHTLFEAGSKGIWTKEDLELVVQYQKKYVNDWKRLADAMGKHRKHVKDAWRRIRLAGKKKGNWSREEYQTLFDLVNKDIRTKAFRKKLGL